MNNFFLGLTGFKPKYILIKNASTAGTNWFIFDTVRNTYNPLSNGLLPNATTIDTDYTASSILLDSNANGFKVIGSNLSYLNKNKEKVF